MEVAGLFLLGLVLASLVGLVSLGIGFVLSTLIGFFGIFGLSAVMALVEMHLLCSVWEWRSFICTRIRCALFFPRRRAQVPEDP